MTKYKKRWIVGLLICLLTGIMIYTPKTVQVEFLTINTLDEFYQATKIKKEYRIEVVLALYSTNISSIQFKHNRYTVSLDGGMHHDYDYQYLKRIDREDSVIYIFHNDKQADDLFDLPKETPIDTYYTFDENKGVMWIRK